MKISIITTSLNSKETIEDTIKSVLAQTYKDIEYIVIDGGSIDGTLNIVDKYRDRINKVVSEKDKGLYDAMNKGIKLATGEVIGILNSDDVYTTSNVVEVVVKQMTEAGADVCWGDLVYVEKDDLSKITRYWKSSIYQNGKFQKGWHPPHPTFFVRRFLYDKYGIFRTDLLLAADYELMLRFLEKYKVSSFYISQTLVKMREGGKSNWKSISAVIKGNIESCKSWKLNGLKHNPLVFIFKPFQKIKQLF